MQNSDYAIKWVEPISNYIIDLKYQLENKTENNPAGKKKKLEILINHSILENGLKSDKIYNAQEEHEQTYLLGGIYYRIRTRAIEEMPRLLNAVILSHLKVNGKTQEFEKLRKEMFTNDGICLN